MADTFEQWSEQYDKVKFFHPGEKKRLILELAENWKILTDYLKSNVHEFEKIQKVEDISGHIKLFVQHTDIKSFSTALGSDNGMSARVFGEAICHDAEDFVKALGNSIGVFAKEIGKNIYAFLQGLDVHVRPFLTGIGHNFPVFAKNVDAMAFRVGLSDKLQMIGLGMGKHVKEFVENVKISYLFLHLSSSHYQGAKFRQSAAKQAEDLGVGLIPVIKQFTEGLRKVEYGQIGKECKALYFGINIGLFFPEFAKGLTRQHLKEFAQYLSKNKSETHYLLSDEFARGLASELTRERKTKEVTKRLKSMHILKPFLEGLGKSKDSFVSKFPEQDRVYWVA